jgi:hypothetical protein
MEAGVYTARSISELHQLVRELAQDGYSIIEVIGTLNDDYHVVVQRNSPVTEEKNEKQS